MPVFSSLDPHTKRAMAEWNVNQDEVTRELRAKAKMLNYWFMYGLGEVPEKMANDILKAKSPEEVRQILYGRIP